MPVGRVPTGIFSGPCWSKARAERARRAQRKLLQTTRKPPCGGFLVRDRRLLRSSGSGSVDSSGSSAGHSGGGTSHSGSGVSSGGSSGSNHGGGRSGSVSSSGSSFLLAASGQGSSSDQGNHQERLVHAYNLRQRVNQLPVMEGLCNRRRSHRRHAEQPIEGCGTLEHFHIQPSIIHTYPNVLLEAERVYRHTGACPLLPGLQLL